LAVVLHTQVTYYFNLSLPIGVSRLVDVLSYIMQWRWFDLTNYSLFNHSQILSLPRGGLSVASHVYEVNLAEGHPIYKLSLFVRIDDPCVRKLTEVVIWGPKHGYFWNVNWERWPGLATIKLSSQRYLLIAPELECCQSRQKCLIACGMNPIFHHKISIADHPHYQITWFLVL